ncbi:MAG TPA: hypothetical protein VN873_14520 [Candidatus Angelobacter sp.]|nr:hypothetical protein [Candidatus Angelobacter sp.]
MNISRVERMGSSKETDRVRRHTSSEALARIDRQIEENIRRYSGQSSSAISKRIQELESEWDIERWLETNASALAFTGTVLGLTVSKKWLVIPLIVTGFLFQHAVQGWCPPVPILRRSGIRTRGEIDEEKFALKVARGDFKRQKADVTRQIAHIKRLIEEVRTA